MQRHISYEVEVIGQTWAGYGSAYSYTFDHEPTFDEIRKRAGDFQGLADYRIVRTCTEGNWEFETTRREVQRDWESEESQDTYMCCVG